MKKLLLIFAFLAVCIGVGLVILAFSLGALVKKGLNDHASKITQSPVALEAATISPIAGTGTLRGLAVGNPEGWSAGNAFSLGNVHLDLDPRTLLDNPVLIEELIIDEPVFRYETRLSGGSNIKDLIANIQEAVGPRGDRPVAEESGSGRKFIIQKLRLRGGVVTVSLGVTSSEVALPELAYDQLGVKEGGLTGAELAAVVLNDILGRVITVATTKGLIKLPGDATGKSLESLGQALQQLMGGADEKAPAAKP